MLLNWELPPRFLSSSIFYSSQKVISSLYSSAEGATLKSKNSTASRLLQGKIPLNTGGGLTTVRHCKHDQIGDADEITVCEYAGHAGHLVLIDNDAAPFVDVDLVGVARSENRNRIESVSDQHDIDRHTEFGARNCFGCCIKLFAPRKDSACASLGKDFAFIDLLGLMQCQRFIQALGFANT
jgi:hypothetical protein